VLSVLVKVYRDNN